MFEFCASPLPKCYEIQPRVLADKRGRFVKVFQAPVFKEYGLETQFVEEYYSVSQRGVVRGMHFQLPPFDHAKLVYCVEGEVLDVALDLRLGSPTYGKTALFKLNAEKGNCVYLPKGFAHGFCVISEVAILVYKVSTTYSPENDTGILWSSIGVDWPVESPIVSERDSNFKPLMEFSSSFYYDCNQSEG